MEPVTLTPNLGNNGYYANEDFESVSRVRIRGEYEFLNLAGARLECPLVAERGSRAQSVLLAGFYAKGVDLVQLYLQILAGQGMKTGYVKFGAVGSRIDLSYSDIGRLDLSRRALAVDLDLRNSVVGIIIFGEDTHHELGSLDLRGATVRKVRGAFPVVRHSLHFDDQTRVAQADFREYLERTRNSLLQTKTGRDLIRP